MSVANGAKLCQLGALAALTALCGASPPSLAATLVASDPRDAFFQPLGEAGENLSLEAAIDPELAVESALGGEAVNFSPAPGNSPATERQSSLSLERVIESLSQLRFDREGGTEVADVPILPQVDRLSDIGQGVYFSNFDGRGTGSATQPAGVFVFRGIPMLLVRSPERATEFGRQEGSDPRLAVNPRVELRLSLQELDVSAQEMVRGMDTQLALNPQTNFRLLPQQVFMTPLDLSDDSLRVSVLLNSSLDVGGSEVRQQLSELQQEIARRIQERTRMQQEYQVTLQQGAREMEQRRQQFRQELEARQRERQQQLARQQRQQFQRGLGQQ